MIHLVFHLTHFDFWIAAQAESWPCQSADVRHDGGLTGGDGGDGVGDGGDDDGGDVDDDGGLTGQNQSQASSSPNCNKKSIWS